MFGPVMISALDCPIVVAAGRVRSAREPHGGARYASGWGLSFDDAARHCRYEADETYAAQLIPGDRIVRARADALPGFAVEPSRLIMFSDAQNRDRRRSAGNNPRPNVRKTSVIDWIADQAEPAAMQTWVPARLCFLDYPGDEDSGIPLADSSGLATGQSFDDARVRAFCELVERDAVAIWWYNNLVMPQLDLSRLGDPVCAAFAAWSRSRSRELCLLLLTLDLPIPVIAALSWDAEGSRIALGTAAGPSIAIAVRRAVGELAQCEANLRLLTQTAEGAGTAAFTPGARDLHAWHTTAHIGAQRFLQGSGTAEGPDGATALDWMQCLMIAERRALRPVAIDLSHSRGPYLARVFVPGLRSTKPRFKRGRLFDVPRSLGMRSLDAAAMSRVPTFPF